VDSLSTIARRRRPTRPIRRASACAYGQAVRIAVLSDLHLGTRTRVDLARRADVRARLVERIRGFDEVVLLGDAIELRDRPLNVALAAAEPFLAELGASLGNGRVVLVPGNHDHRLVHETLDGRRGSGSLVQDIGPGRRGAAGAIRDRLATELVVAYPGWRVTDRVWATHGHYLDAHSNAPTLECVMAALTGLARRRPAMRAGSERDYEAVLAPAYGLYYRVAQRPRLGALADAGKALVRRAEAGLGTRGPADRRACGRAIARLRLGGGRLGPVPGELRRPGLLPFALVLERLGIEADHVLFGHTHRAGPLPGDPASSWRCRNGTALWNTGSWVYDPGRVAHDRSSPYWPGTLVTLEGSDPPRLQHLLGTIPEEVGTHEKTARDV
jgi:predicted phosphodiesterase